MKHQHQPYSLYNLFKITDHTKVGIAQQILDKFSKDNQTQLFLEEGIVIDSPNLDYIQYGYLITISPNNTNTQVLIVKKLNQNPYQVPQYLAHLLLHLGDPDLEYISTKLKQLLPEIKVNKIQLIMDWHFMEYRNTSPNFDRNQQRVIKREFNILSNFTKLNQEKFTNASQQDILIGTTQSGFGKEAFAVAELYGSFELAQVEQINGMTHLQILGFTGAFLPAQSYNKERVKECSDQINEMIKTNSFPNSHISYLAIELVSFIQEQMDIIQNQANAYSLDKLLDLINWFKAVERLISTIYNSSNLEVYSIGQKAVIVLLDELVELTDTNSIIDSIEQIKYKLTGYQMSSLLIILKTLESLVNNPIINDN